MRYSRQIQFKEFGKFGQDKIRKSRVTIVGVGALGSRCAELLVRAGIGKIIIIDRDFVELNNLQRQTLYTEEDVDKSKVIQLEKHLSAINKEVKIESHVLDLDHKNISKYVKGDLILGCTDNMDSRFLINEFSAKNSIPWIHGGAIESYGNLFVTIPGKTCFRCIFKEVSNMSTCDTVGVLNTIPSIIASLQVSETIKVLLKKKYEKDLIYFDAWRNELSKIKVKQNKACPACNHKFSYLKGDHAQDHIRFCGSDKFQINGKITNFSVLKKRLSGIGKVLDWGYCIHFKDMTIFKDGRALIRAKDLNHAKSLYSRYVGN